MTCRLTIEYDGTDFAGWAIQPGVRTVQAELERALAVVLRQSAAHTVAGRTDRGVHAWAQVASYEGPPALVPAVNALLPDDVAVIQSVTAPDGFDARYDCTSRAYCFRVMSRKARSALHRSQALHWRPPVDIDALHACAALLPGKHDFTAFTPADTYHVRFDRDIWAAQWRWAQGHQLGAAAPGTSPADFGGVLEFWIEADSYMRHMNRILVGTMLDVARGRYTTEHFASLLEGRPREEAGLTAKAGGLYFAGAGYRGERLIAT